MQLIKENLVEQIKNICEKAIKKDENNFKKDENFCVNDGFISGKGELAKEILKLLKDN